jgi:hypothetical protein
MAKRQRLTRELQLVSDQLIVALLRRLNAVTAERDRYREVSQAAIHALHDLTERHERHLFYHSRLREELRQLRHQDKETEWQVCTDEARA